MHRTSVQLESTLTDMKGEVDNTKTIVKFKIPLSTMDRSDNISEETLNMNNILDQIHLTDIFRTLIRATEHKFSRAHRTFSRIDHVLGHRTSAKNFKRLKSYQIYFLTIMIWTRNQYQKET